MRLIAVLAILIFTPVTAYGAPSFSVPEIEGYAEFGSRAAEIAGGGLSLDPIEILNNITDGVMTELRSFAAEAAVIAVMALLSAVVGTAGDISGEGSAGKAAFFAFFTVISGFALSCFNTALSYGTEVISLMTGFMTKLTPVLIIMLFTCCKAASAAAFEPVLSAAVFVASVVIEKCLVPLMTFSAVMAVAGNIGDRTRISNFIKIVHSVTKWLMALVMTLFTGINAIYGFSASALDAVGAKTIKFAVGSLVPVVGGFLSDTLDTVASSASLLKNAAGVSGMIVICGMCAMPVIKIGVMQLLLKLAAAMVEPVADRRISSMLWDVSGAVTSVFGTVILTAVLFLINICIILTATG